MLHGYKGKMSSIVYLRAAFYGIMSNMMEWSAGLRPSILNWECKKLYGAYRCINASICINNMCRFHKSARGRNLSLNWC